MLASNRDNTAAHYPLAVVAVSMADMVAGLLHVRGMAYLSMRVPFWEMFDHADAFSELFVLAVCHLDALWVTRSAQRTDYGALIRETKGMIECVLARGPRSLQMLRVLAEDEGMALPALESPLE